MEDLEAVIVQAGSNRGLPPYSPDLNPIEMAFSKLKALLRKGASTTFDTLCQALGDICGLFDPIQCRNFLKAAGYETE